MSRRQGAGGLRRHDPGRVARSIANGGDLPINLERNDLPINHPLRPTTIVYPVSTFYHINPIVTDDDD